MRVTGTDLEPAGDRGWRPRIAVVGCGALGSYYGARLSRAGQDVHFLLRSDYDTVQRAGVRVESVEGDFEVRPRCARAPEEIGACDLVLVALKTTANREFGRLLPPLVGPETAVVSLQNGLGDEEELAALFGAARVLGGLCFVCLNRLAPGVIRHTAHGLVVLGEHGGGPQPRTQAIAGLLRQAGIPCRVTEHLARSHWEKLIWNIPFNGLGVAGTVGYDAVLAGQVPPGVVPGSTLSTEALLADARWEALVRALMAEVIAAAGAQGFDIEARVADEQVERTRVMGAYRASTLIDFEQGRELEVAHLFLEPLRRARAAGVVTPRLEALCRVLETLNVRTGG